MGAYIDADKTIAEIESRMGDCKLPNGKFPTTTNVVRYEELSCLRNFIISIQQEQPEVDLEKEIIRYQREDMDRDTTIRDVARHFYNLGLNARKEG